MPQPPIISVIISDADTGIMIDDTMLFIFDFTGFRLE